MIPLLCTDGKIVKTDVSVAKNYLTETELEFLGRIVNAYLDLAEDRAKRRIPMFTMICPYKNKNESWCEYPVNIRLPDLYTLKI